MIDDEADIRCASGSGLVREEVWEDASGKVMRYNLAFINHFLTSQDNGRVLGYDNRHGYHHRHYKGGVQPYEFSGYAATAFRFFAEVDELKKEKR